MRAAYQALDDVMKAWQYRPRAGVTGAASCRPITGGTGYSLHAYFDGERFAFWSGATVTMAVAVDVNWDRNPYGPRLVTDMPRGMIDAILAIRTHDGLQVWGWGGLYAGNKDAMHFELHVTPAQLARGIQPTGAPPPPPTGPLAWVGAFDHPDGNGYWTVAANGTVRAFGSAQHHGDPAGLVARPLVGGCATPSGNGYWLCGADGGVFAYGDAGFFGSTGAIALNKPVVGMAARAQADGYWLFGADGGVFAFGAAPFAGSAA
jgi:hypothetical protein